MKFSIVIITYNQPQHVETLLRALSAQDYVSNDFEVILIEDGSQHSLDITDLNLPFKFNYQYLPRTQNSSRSRARNHGAQLCNGEYLIFLDGDTVPEGNLLTKYANYFNIRPDRSVVLGARVDQPPMNQITLMHRFTKQNYHDVFKGITLLDGRVILMRLMKACLSDFMGAWVFFVSCNFCIKRTVFMQVNGFSEEFKGWGLEDSEFGYRLLSAGYKFDLINNTTIHLSHRQINDESNKKKYISWRKNVGVFYNIHKDPAILLLKCSDSLMYRNFYLGNRWDIPKGTIALRHFFDMVEEIHKYHKQIENTPCPST